MKSTGKEKVTPSSEELEIKAAKRRKRKKTAKRIIRIVLILLIIAVAAFFAYNRYFKKETVVRTVSYTYANVERRNIVEELSGSGTLESADSYTLSTRVGGDILSDTFAEGDTVKEGDVLYVLDSSEMDEKLERAEKSLATAKEKYEEKLADRANLNIVAPIGGVVSGLNVNEGDSLRDGTQVLKITAIDTLILTEYYSTEYMDSIKVGMSANVSISSQMLSLSGKVTKVSPLTRTSETGVVCFPVTIEVKNPGSLTVGTLATAFVDDMYPTITSTVGLEASATKTVSAKVNGDINELNVSNGDVVKEGMILLSLSGDDLEDEIESAYDSVEDAQLSLDNIYESIDNYTLTAPIDGTVVRKVLKAGETAESGATLCMIYDLSYLTVTLAIDELDIKKLSVGQRATVTADAMEGYVFEGRVTRVGVNGTTSGGVTTYPVDIRIDKTDGLLPGMNVDIVIAVREAIDVLAVPVDAVQRNNRVAVKNADGTTGEGAPEGCSYVTVEIGMADEDYVEIVSGLNDGDTVAYVSRSITTSGSGFGMGMMPGGNMMGGNMMGGGTRPQSGMSGGMPSMSGNMGGGNRPQGGANRGGF